MCGIAGAIGWGDRDTIECMVAAQFHRGPDDGGIFDGTAASGVPVRLGSRRLAIVDLSPAGHMPMSNEDGSIQLVYNGEIYNAPRLRAELVSRGYRFRSRTDTEVVLRLYEELGPDCVTHFDGMFALALWDARRQHLFLARDPFGIKPLYYVQDGERFAFASEIKSLLYLPGFRRNLDVERIHQFLTFLWVPDPHTILEGVHKLPAGHWAIVRGRDLVVQQYWDIEFPPADHVFPRSETELVDELRDRLRGSVRDQLLSDVPVGAFLSSGLDSTSIVASIGGAADDPVRTYTIVFPPHHRRGEVTLDDTAIARQVAQRFGTVHHEIVVEPDVVGLLPRIVWHLDEPIADPAAITAYLICRDAKATSTVLLSGVGGDELFAGYRKHVAHGIAERYRRIPALLRKGVIEPLVAALPSMRGTRVKGYVRLAKKMARSGSLPPEQRFLMDSTYFTEEQKRELYLAPLRDRLAHVDPWSTHRAHFRSVEHAEFLNRMLYLDTKAFMVSLNLTYNDRMSMASSVEVRVPFLQKGLAEFAAQEVPPALKLRGRTTKWLLREAVRGVIPDAVLNAPKAGFGAPVDYWLAGDLRPVVDDLLSEGRIKERGLFDHGAVQKLVREQRSGRKDWSLHIWALLTLELWLQSFVDSPSPPPVVDHRETSAYAIHQAAAPGTV